MGNNTENTGTMTTVKTVYARAAVLLLALNFCLTGYVVLNLNKTVQEQVDDAAKNAAITMGTTKTPSTLVREPSTATVPVPISAPERREATTESP